jgi:hypothetical protein
VVLAGAAFFALLAAAPVASALDRAAATAPPGTATARLTVDERARLTRCIRSDLHSGDAVNARTHCSGAVDGGATAVARALRDAVTRGYVAAFALLTVVFLGAVWLALWLRAAAAAPLAAPARERPSLNKEVRRAPA